MGNEAKGKLLINRHLTASGVSLNRGFSLASTSARAGSAVAEEYAFTFLSLRSNNTHAIKVSKIEMMRAGRVFAF